VNGGFHIAAIRLTMLPLAPIAQRQW